MASDDARRSHCAPRLAAGSSPVEMGPPQAPAAASAASAAAARTTSAARASTAAAVKAEAEAEATGAPPRALGLGKDNAPPSFWLLPQPLLLL